MIEFPKTTYTMESYTYHEGIGSSDEVRISKTSQEETVTELAEMFMKFLQGNGFTYVKGVAVMTDNGLEFTTDDYYSYFEDNESSEPDVTLDFYDGEEQPEFDFYDGEEQFEFDFSSEVNPADVSLNITPEPVSLQVNGYPTESIWSQSPGYASVNVTGVNVRGSIDDATPEEWDALKK